MKDTHHLVAWGACLLFSLSLRENTGETTAAASARARARIESTLRTSAPSPREGPSRRVPSPSVAVVLEPLFRPIAAQRAPSRGYVLDQSGFSEGGRWAMLSHESNTTVFVASDTGVTRAVSATQFLTRRGTASESFALHGAPFAAQHTPTEPLLDRSERYAVGASGDALFCFDLEAHTSASLGRRPATAPVFSPDRERIAWRCDSAKDGPAVCVFHFEARRLRRVALDVAPPALHWLCAADRQRCELSLTSSRPSIDEDSYAFWQGLETTPGDGFHRGAPSALLIDADTGAIEAYRVNDDSLTYLERSPDGRYVVARLSAGGLAVFERRKSAPFFTRTAPARRWLWQSEGRALAWTDERTGRIEGDAQTRTRVALRVVWLESGAERGFAGPDGCADGTEFLSEFSGDVLRTELTCGGGTNCFERGGTRHQRSYDARSGRRVRARPAIEPDVYCQQQRAMRGRARDAASVGQGGARPSWVQLADDGERGVVQRSTGITVLEPLPHWTSQRRLFAVGELSGVTKGLDWSLLAGRGGAGWLGVNDTGEAILWRARSAERVWSSAAPWRGAERRLRSERYVASTSVRNARIALQDRLSASAS